MTESNGKLMMKKSQLAILQLLKDNLEGSCEFITRDDFLLIDDVSENDIDILERVAAIRIDWQNKYYHISPIGKKALKNQYLNVCLTLDENDSTKGTIKVVE